MLLLEAVIEVDDEKRTRRLETEAAVVNIGRESTNEFMIPLTTVSRNHARISLLDNQYFIEDLGSSHGSMLNGAKLTANDKKLLRDNDVITLTKARITVNIVKAEAKKDIESTQVFAERAVQNILDQLGTENNDDVPFLRVMSGPDDGQKFMLRDKVVECVLGRSRDSDLVVNDANASRRHAIVKKDRNGVVFQCLGAKNLSQVNGKDVPRSTTKRLKNGDEIRIGEVKIVFIDPSAALLDSIEIPGFAPEPDPPSEPLQAEPGDGGDGEGDPDQPATIGLDPSVGGPMDPEGSNVEAPDAGEEQSVAGGEDGADGPGEQAQEGEGEGDSDEGEDGERVELPAPGEDPQYEAPVQTGFNPLIIFAIMGAVLLVALIIVLIAIV